MDRFITAFVNQWIPIVNHWLHLMAAILWIGSLGFLMMAVVPSLRKSVPHEFFKPLANAIYQRYQKIVAVLMLIILDGRHQHLVHQQDYEGGRWRRVHEYLP